MKSIYRIVVLMLYYSSSFAQNPVTYYLGIGKSISNYSKMHFIVLHNEIALKINRSLSTSFDLQVARSYRGPFDKSEYIQGNWNIMAAPFKNEKKLFFRVGSGLFYNHTWNYFDPIIYPEYDKRVSIFRVSLFLEEEFKISTTTLLGLRLFTYPEFSTNKTISGALIKVGFRLR